MADINPLEKKIIDRISVLVNNADRMLIGRSGGKGEIVDPALFRAFRSSSLSFIGNLYPANHPYYLEFEDNVFSNEPYRVKIGKEILNAILEEIKSGWYKSIRKLVSAEIFSDYYEMAVYILSEGYKIPSALIISGILESHLKTLAKRNDIKVENDKNGKNYFVAAGNLNIELHKKEIYDSIYYNSIKGWLEIRNQAAHGKFESVSEDQVKIMIEGIINFINTTN